MKNQLCSVVSFTRCLQHFWLEPQQSGLHSLRPRRGARTSATLVLLATLCLWSLPASANLAVRSAILMDMASGKVLYAQSPDRAIPPASLTKIMTMHVALDYIRAGKAKLTDKVRISSRAAHQGGSRMHLKTGERVTLDRLLTGVAVSSGNDASMAVAEHLAGSGQAFVKLMNAKAREFGMKGTTFRNPHGLPAKGQVTTARDMLILSNHYLKKHPSAMRYHRTRTLTHRGVTTVNKNPLLRSMPGADGLKTGWIRASGYNLVSTAKRGKTRLLAVVLGSSSSKVRAGESQNLMEAGFKAVNSGGRVKVADMLGKHSAHSDPSPDVSVEDAVAQFDAADNANTH